VEWPGSPWYGIVQWFQVFKCNIYDRLRLNPVPDGHARAPGKPRAVRVSALLVASARAAEHAADLVSNGLKSADVDVPDANACGAGMCWWGAVSRPDAADRRLSDVGVFQHTLLGIPVSRKTISYGSFDPRSDAVQRSSEQQFISCCRTGTQAPAVQSEALTRTSARTDDFDASP